MAATIKPLFRAPYSTPNGLQVTEEGLWVADQLTDRVALVEIAKPNEYGVTRILKEIPTESSNTSGLAWGEGSLWLAANGPGSRWRPARETDATSGEILQVDPETGQTLRRLPLPGGGGTHGVEVDRFEEGTLWLTTLKDQTLTQIRVSDGSIRRVVPLPHTRAHGVVRVEDGIWVVHTADRVIVMLDADTGGELGRIEVPEPHPEPHGLSAHGDALLYCDAASGWVVKVESGQ
ncbi:MAG: hypothetical protein QGI83_20815 [Candidatus Latescibacteria bacterium]|jgi:streptogramin lyase|nr:hypothetical protein [Candidatus Latescibacterota bacterium]